MAKRLAHLQGRY